MTVFQKYGAILADPPWDFKAWSAKGTGRSAQQHYDTLPLSKLTSLPILNVAAKDCALFLWVVDSHLDQGIELMKQWGFVYKTIAFIWVKPSIGMGKWTRKMAEVCLLGTAGKPHRLSAAVQQVVHAPRREHSRKPDEIYPRIEALVGGPYLEMFARQQWPGWDTWGDETEKFQAS